MYKESFTAADLLSVDPALVIGNATCVDVEAFDDAFLEAAKIADEGGKAREALVLRLFAAVSRFHFRPGDRKEPFSNMISWADGSRSLMGSDFDSEDIDAIATAVEGIALLPLRIRLADLAWSRDKAKVDQARIAIDGYVQLVNKVLDGSGTLRFEQSSATGISVQNFLERAIVIARSTGWEKPENESLRATFASVLRVASLEGGMALVRFARLGLRYGVSGVEEEIGDVDAKAEAARDAREFHEAIALQELANSFAARSNQGEIPAASKLRLASIYERQADVAEGSSLLQTHALQSAIDALQGAKGVREERQRLHDKLKEAQLHFADEMGSFGHSVDLTDEVARLLSGYDGLDLLECLKRLALTEMPKDPELLIRNAREEAEKYPLSSLFATSIIDQRGRTVARAGGDAGDNEALRHKIIQHLSINTSLAVSAAINPARAKITERFTVNEDLFYAICRYSPFVPSGHEVQVARGLEAFLYGDDYVSCGLLIPFLETGLRSLVSIAGRSDTTISLGGIEQTIGLGNLLGQHRDILEKIFGQNVIYAIENLFVHELGPKVRHIFCHGMASDGALNSHHYVYSCKLIYSLVMLPIINGEFWDAIKPQLAKLIEG